MPEIDQFVKLPLEERRSIFKRLVFKTVPEGEVKGTAFAAGLKTYTLYKMRDETIEDYNLIRPELIDILHHRKDLRILDFLETLFGRVAYTIPQSLESLEDISRHITRVFKEASAACQAIVDSVDPGSLGGAEITWEEFKKIQEEIRSAHRQLAALEEAARKKSQKHPSWPLRLVAKVMGRRGPGL